MRQRAHDKGAWVQAVIASTTGSVCHLLAALPDQTIPQQLHQIVDAQKRSGESGARIPHRSDGSSHSCMRDRSGSRQSRDVHAARCGHVGSVKHLLALPAECNVTGICPCKETLMALSHGRVELPPCCHDQV
jgi:hypothetical protein